MILAVDIGNSNIVIGVYRGDHLIRHWRLSTRQHATADEYGILLTTLFASSGLESVQVRGVALASVVPPLVGAWQQMLQEQFGIEPLLITNETTSALRIMYDNPAEVGADRIVNAIAGIRLYGAPLIVVDFGTATTFDAIDASGSYLGGAIAPGIGISTEALFARAAKLPRVELVRPPRAIGRNPASSMQSGIIFGFAGQVDALVRRFWAELGGRTTVVATGGLADLIAAETETVDRVDPLLTLEGLRIIYEIHQEGEAGYNPNSTG